MQFIQRVLRRVREISSYQFTIYAGNAAFFTVLSMFPAAVLLMTLIRITPLSAESLMQMFGLVIPESLQTIFFAVLEGIHTIPSTTVISISAIAVAWSSSRGMLGILNGVNAIYHVKDRRGYLRKRFLCLIYMILLIVGIILTLTLQTFGQKLLVFIGNYLPGLTRVVEVLLQLKLILVIAFLTLLFTAIFYYFPNCKTSLRYSFPGAITAAIGWAIFSELFSIYVNYNPLSALYGSVAMIILLMLWIYFSMVILMFGGVINQLLRSGRIRPLRSFFSFHSKQSKDLPKPRNSSSNVTKSTNTVDF